MNVKPQIDWSKIKVPITKCRAHKAAGPSARKLREEGEQAAAVAYDRIKHDVAAAREYQANKPAPVAPVVPAPKTDAPESSDEDFNVTRALRAFADSAAASLASGEGEGDEDFNPDAEWWE